MCGERKKNIFLAFNGEIRENHCGKLFSKKKNFREKKFCFSFLVCEKVICLAWDEIFLEKKIQKKNPCEGK